MTSCTECPARLKCTKLCKKMESYVNQDNVDDTAWRKIKCTDSIEQYPSKNTTGMSTTEVILQDFFVDSRSVAQIAQKYCKSRQYVHRIIKKYQKLLVVSIKKTIQKG